MTHNPTPTNSSIAHLEENIAAASIKLTADEIDLLNQMHAHAVIN